MWQIPFNKPYTAGKELFYIAQAMQLGNLSGDGHFTKRCCSLLEQRFGFRRVLMTPSCTAALEMAVMLYDIGPGDEVLMPSFTFVSTANAVVRLGARPHFVDICPETLNVDPDQLASAVTSRTRALLPVHYGGVACEMDRICELARQIDCPVIEDAAQGVNAFYGDRVLGSIGSLGAYSFHDTKNYSCGEGGALCINEDRLIERAENIRNKGTNRSQFLRGEVDKYTWVDVGSSYVANELSSAYLYGQLELMDQIAARRRTVYDFYFDRLTPLADSGHLRLPVIPPNCTSNYHLFYVLLKSGEVRTRLMEFLRQRSIQAVFHYVPLHSAPLGRKVAANQNATLPVTDDISERLLRLPFYHDIQTAEQQLVVDAIAEFFHE
ncbi:MAG: dTDP-4-amino-4,6-dideoxygalactose transaminase [Fuerstiella sp.]